MANITFLKTIEWRVTQVPVTPDEELGLVSGVTDDLVARPAEKTADPACCMVVVHGQLLGSPRRPLA
jgi:hypothetical protein